VWALPTSSYRAKLCVLCSAIALKNWILIKPCLHCMSTDGRPGDRTIINLLLLGLNLTMKSPFLPQLNNLPTTLPMDGAIRIELVEGIPVFRASSAVKARIEELLTKQQHFSLSLEEEQELDCYEEIDDYLSFVNRLVRNQFLIQTQQAS
jgi:hypothetical protein